MQKKEPNYWMVRAGKDGVLYDKFKSGNIIAINFPEVGNVVGKDDKGIREAVKRGYPNDSPQQRGAPLGTHRRFCLWMSRGDGVITPVSGAREYLLGEVMGECKYQKKEEGYRHYRAVKWHKKTVSRDSLTSVVRYSLGGLGTIFRINDHWEEIYSQLSSNAKKELPQPGTDKTDALVAEELAEQINRRVEDKIAGLGWEKVEHLVAALLRAMGYRTKMTRKGGDGGFDIYASPDELMLQEPRIRAEVKRRQSAMAVGDIREFDSAKGKARGIFVSIGGYTKNAITEAHNKDIILLNLSQFAELVVRHYDNFDAEGRKILPMQKLYLPVSD